MIKKVIYNAEGVVLGRLGSVVCKDLLKGKEVFVINSEKAIITGRKEDIIGKITYWRSLGGKGLKGPKVSKSPERLLKRMIRGMLPWDRQKGKDAFKRLRCYTSKDILDFELKDVVELEKKKPLKYITVEEVSRSLQ